MTQHLTEKQALRSGGTPALAAMFSEHQQRLERIISFRMDARVRRRVDPSDVLQEAWLEISGRIDEFLDAADVSFFVWIRHKALQTLIDTHRRHFREKRDVNREMRIGNPGCNDGTSVSIAEFLLGNQTSPSAVAVKAEEKQRLQEALNGMNEIDREVLALRHFEQLSNNQTAEILGISVTAASNRYLRAAAKLSEMLTPFESGSDNRE